MDSQSQSKANQDLPYHKSMALVFLHKYQNDLQQVLGHWTRKVEKISWFYTYNP